MRTLNSEKEKLNISASTFLTYKTISNAKYYKKTGIGQTISSKSCLRTYLLKVKFKYIEFKILDSSNETFIVEFNSPHITSDSTSGS